MTGKTVKTGDMSPDDFSAKIKENIAATIEQARASGVTDAEIDELIAANYNEHKSVAFSRVLSRIRKQIGNQVDIKSASPVAGLLVGCRDKYGKSAPIRYLLLTKDKKHFEVSNFGHTTVYKDQSEFTIPFPSLITLRVRPNVEYNSWELAGIDEIKRENVERDQMVEILTHVEIEPKTITKDMAWSREHPAKPVVIYGKIHSIRPEVVFTRDEDDKPKKDYDLPVWVEREDKSFQPCFSFNLMPGGGKFIRCHIEHQRYGQPTLMVEEISRFCERAVEKHPNDPDAQAKYLKDWLEDVPVMVSGVISSYRESLDKEGKTTTNVEIGVAAVVEVGERVPGEKVSTKQAPIAPPEKPTPPPPPKTQPANEEPQPQPTTTKPEPGPLTIRNIAADIKLWCTAANVDPASITLNVIREKAAERYSNAPDSAIRCAIDMIKHGDV